MDWTRGQTIGHGSSATVSLATSHLSGGIFAVKSSEFSQSEFLQREQKILSSLNSPHVVGYRGCDITRESNKLMYNLIMEYVPGGTLNEVINKHGGKLDESTIGVYTRQIVQGLEYIHANGLVHCDIKGQNILIGQEGAKIADFGCSKLADQRIGYGEMAAGEARISGTPLFMAPEVARGEEQGCSADIWALGCTIIEMATGGSPWPNATDPVSVLYRIAYSGELPPFPDFLSDQTKDFLGKCLRRNPNKRWTASQLLEHPFLGEFNSLKKQIHDYNSPTSILDQDIWNSYEDSSSQSQTNNLVHTSPENSLDERIKQLSKFSEVPSWDCDENWITLRSNSSHESNTENMDQLELTLDMDMEELESSVQFSDRSGLMMVCKCREDNCVVSDHKLEVDTDDFLPLNSISRFL